MNYGVITTESFERKIKYFSKKYHSFLDDLEVFKQELLKNPTMGEDLGNDTRKVRMAIASKNKGKSGGARIITYHIIVNIVYTKIFLLTIYDKGEQKSISKKEIQNLKEINGLI